MIKLGEYKNFRSDDFTPLSEVEDMYVAVDRAYIRRYTDKLVSEYCRTGIIPTMNQIYARLYKDLDFKDYEEAQDENKRGVEVLSGRDIAKNIQNLCSFNLDDDIYESIKLKIKEDVEYTDTIDAIYDILKRTYRGDDRFVDIKIVNKPKRAVRVETEKELEDGTNFNMDRYIYVDDSNRITMMSKDDKTRKFVDVDAVLDFFDEYLNS